MTTFIIISSLIILATLIAGAIEGNHDATYGTDPDHKKDFGVRLIIGILVSFPFNFAFLSEWVVFLVASVFMLLALGFGYGLLLDISFNLKRGLPLTYIGNTALSDIEARKIRKKGIWLLVVKLMGFAFSVFFYYAWIFHKP